MLKKLIAASAPQAGYFSLLVQRKVTKRSGPDAHPCAGQTFVRPCTAKAAPEPPIPVLYRDVRMPRSAWMRESGRFSPRPGASRTRRAQKTRPAQTPARETPRPWLCWAGCPNAAKHMDVRERPMLGGGYGSQRQKQHRSPKAGYSLCRAVTHRSKSHAAQFAMLIAPYAG